MKKNLLYIGFIAFALASCSQLDVVELPVQQKTIDLKASIESESSRVSINGGKVYWSKGDKISALLEGGGYAILDLDANDDGNNNGTFTGDSNVSLAQEGFHAFYPACIEADGTNSIVLPESYNVGSDFANANAIMKATGSADGELSFKHLGGVIKLTLNNLPATTSKIRFTTLDNRAINGSFTLTSGTNEGDPEYVKTKEGDGSKSTIEVSFEALTETSNVEISFPLPVGSYKGIRLEFLNESDKATAASREFADATNTIARATRVVMPALTCVSVVETPEGTKIAEGVYQDADNNYLITSSAGMLWMAQQVNSHTEDTVDEKNFVGKVFRLANNIDMAGVEWTPVGTDSKYGSEFNASFDGNGMTIYNLSVNEVNGSAGLFGYVSTEKYGYNTNASIRNLTIDHATIRSNHYAGAIAGWVQGAYKIENCHVTNSSIISEVEFVDGEWDNGDKVGGVVGYMAQKGTTVNDCSISNTSETGYRDLGGIVGYVNYKKEDGPTHLTNNTIGIGVTIIQDLNHSYMSTPDKILCGSIYGFAADGAQISGNTGMASITVKAYDTETAQLAIDAATSGRTIELAAGSYDNLVLRHTKPTTVIKNSDGTANTNGKYYHRALENFTIKAADGANVSVDGITINSGHVYTSDATNPAYNYVVDVNGVAIQSTNVYNYYAYFYLRNFVIDGFTLTKNVYIGADSSQENNRYFDVDGFTLQNCQKIGTDETKKTDNGNKLIRIGGPSVQTITNPLRIKNVTVRNCKAQKVYQGVYAYGPVDYTVENCEFDDLGHNVLQVGAGKVTFQNNVIKNCNTDRLFRISSDNFPAEDWVKILNNTITNSIGDSSDATYPYFKAGADGTLVFDVTFEGNTMDGEAWTPL